MMFFFGRILVNAEHSLTDHRVSLFLGMRAFYLSVLYNYPRPDIRWERTITKTGGIITLYATNAVPIVVNAYFAVTEDGIRYSFILNVCFKKKLIVYIFKPRLSSCCSRSKQTSRVYIVFTYYRNEFR
jgi:hypothetical protein